MINSSFREPSASNSALIIVTPYSSFKSHNSSTIFFLSFLLRIMDNAINSIANSIVSTLAMFNNMKSIIKKVNKIIKNERRKRKK